MSVGPEARTGLLMVAALLVGLVGPCICGPSAAVTQAAHGCCDAEAGLKPAPLDCCAGCSLSLRAQESGLLRASSPWALLPSAPSAAEPTLRQSVARLSSRLQALVVPSPPPVLRV